MLFHVGRKLWLARGRQSSAESACTHSAVHEEQEEIPKQTHQHTYSAAQGLQMSEHYTYCAIEQRNTTTATKTLAGCTAAYRGMQA